MTSLLDGLNLDGIPILRMESNFLKVDVAPEVGGRIVSLVEKRTGYEYLWRNPSTHLRVLPARSEYDPNFFGGIDELLPNDIEETINGVACPDHGELWTMPLKSEINGDRIKLRGTLSNFGLEYEREMFLRQNGLGIDLAYRISNPTLQPRSFLWKLHAALNIVAGDVIDCPAYRAQAVDLAWSRRKTLVPFDWPIFDGQAVNIIPAPDGTVDFLHLFALTAGKIAWRRPGTGLNFTYHFDTRVFPYAWLFASYGGFNGHYTVILEPCTTMPISVNEAAAKGQCSVLKPGETLETRVSITVGHT